MKQLIPLLILVMALCFTPLVFAQEGAADWGFESEDSPRETTSQTSNANDEPNWDGLTGVIWNERPLRETLANFAAHNRLGFLLDRRVDPGTLISLDIKQTPVRDVFERAAEQCGLATCEFETLIYIGPVEAAEQLRLLSILRGEQLGKLPMVQRETMLAPRSFSAEILDSPKETLQRLAAEIGFDGTAFDRLPHDVWPKIDFPNEPASTIFSLILIGFDSTFAVSKDATKLAPIPIPRELVVTREYKGPIARQLTEPELLQLAPDALIAPIPQGVGVEAPLEQLAKIEMLIAKRTKESERENRPINRANQSQDADDAAVRLQHERFTVAKLDASLDQALKAFADRMQLELILDEKSFEAKNVRLDTRISTSFEQATFTEVFEKCLTPIGAKFRINGNTITVYME